MPEHTPKKLFTITFACIITSSLFADDAVSIDSVCTQPTVMGSKIVTVCNDIDFSDRSSNHAIHLDELDENLTITKHVKLDIDNSDVGRLVKIDEQHAYLLAQTRSKCIKVSDLQIRQEKAIPLLDYCDNVQLSLPYETYSQSIRLEDQSLLFPVLSKGSDATIVKVIHINSQKEYQVFDMQEYKNYIPISFVKFVGRSILHLRSKDDPLKAVLISFTEDKSGKLEHTKLYETSSFLVMTVSNADENVLIAGNDFTDDNMFFSLYEVGKSGSVKEVLRSEPVLFRPAFTRADKSSIDLYGVIVDTALQAKAVSTFRVGSISAPELKFKSLEKVSTDKYPLPLITTDGVSYIILGPSTYLLPANCTKQQKKQLKYTDLSVMQYPSLFYLKHQQYLFYIVKEKNRFRSVIEKL